jgi:glycosyltransferase involved in cell wall biosynthesis
MPELINEGVNGYLADVGDAVMFADNIRGLAQDRLLLKRLKIGARLFAEKNLDDKLGYLEYDAALSEIIQSDRCVDVNFTSSV